MFCELVHSLLWQISSLREIFVLLDLHLYTCTEKTTSFCSIENFFVASTIMIHYAHTTARDWTVGPGRAEHTYTYTWLTATQTEAYMNTINVSIYIAMQLAVTCRIDLHWLHMKWCLKLPTFYTRGEELSFMLHCIIVVTIHCKSSILSYSYHSEGR